MICPRSLRTGHEDGDTYGYTPAARGASGYNTDSDPGEATRWDADKRFTDMMAGDADDTGRLNEPLQVRPDGIHRSWGI